VTVPLFDQPYMISYQYAVIMIIVISCTVIQMLLLV